MFENDKISMLNIKVSKDGLMVKAAESYPRNREFDPQYPYTGWMKAMLANILMKSLK